MARITMAPAHPEVSAFIRASFRSVWDLELLCYLRRYAGASHPQARLVTDLRASELVVANSISGLLAAGLVVVEPDGSARYKPASEELDRSCDAAEALYGRSPDAVRRMIVTASNPAISAFADAFRLRKD
ncbi:MAG TPA: hypothetical protein VGB54_00560 [Allosphingosinicella sp.]|jgi:hypothetical protein